MPKTIFDLGAVQINANDIILFGGFDSGAKDDAYIYKTGPDDGSFSDAKKLQSPDFFVQNGVFIKILGDKTQWIFNGHNHMHLFDQDNMEFRTLSM